MIDLKRIVHNDRTAVGGKRQICRHALPRAARSPALQQLKKLVGQQPRLRRLAGCDRAAHRPRDLRCGRHALREAQLRIQRGRRTSRQLCGECQADGLLTIRRQCSFECAHRAVCRKLLQKNAHERIRVFILRRQAVGFLCTARGRRHVHKPVKLRRLRQQLRIIRVIAADGKGPPVFKIDGLARVEQLHAFSLQAGHRFPFDLRFADFRVQTDRLPVQLRVYAQRHRKRILLHIGIEDAVGLQLRAEIPAHEEHARRDGKQDNNNDHRDPPADALFRAFRNGDRAGRAALPEHPQLLLRAGKAFLCGKRPGQQLRVRLRRSCRLCNRIRLRLRHSHLLRRAFLALPELSRSPACKVDDQEYNQSQQQNSRCPYPPDLDRGHHGDAHAAAAHRDHKIAARRLILHTLPASVVLHIDAQKLRPAVRGQIAQPMFTGVSAGHLDAPLLHDLPVRFQQREFARSERGEITVDAALETARTDVEGTGCQRLRRDCDDIVI